MPGIDKLLRGVLRYNKHFKPGMVGEFQRIRDNPEPKAVMFSCMDSRIITTRIVQSHVGDMFLVRNAGNLVPHSDCCTPESASTEPAALELGCIVNNIRHVAVCGHSDCKAMLALLSIRDSMDMREGSPMQLYLKRQCGETLAKYTTLEKSGFTKSLTFQGETPRHNFEAYIDPENKFQHADKLSQVNALQQLQNIASYQFLRPKLESNELRLHAMWFDIYTGDFYMFSRKEKRFVEITDSSLDDLLKDADSLT